MKKLLISILVLTVMLGGVASAEDKLIKSNDIISYRFCKNLSTSMLQTLNLKIDLKNKLVMNGVGSDMLVYKAKIYKNKVKSKKLIAFGNETDKKFLKMIGKTVKFSYEINLNTGKVIEKVKESNSIVEITNYECNKEKT